jgi:MoaA/NifB/PqqE/SkfB family radical SAM enzyme
MPATANFSPLDREPTADDIYQAVDDAFEKNLIVVSSMDSDEITFAGIGEPLLRLETMTSAAKLIVEKRHGARLRLKTSGLILSKDCSNVGYVYALV